MRAIQAQRILKHQFTWGTKWDLKRIKGKNENDDVKVQYGDGSFVLTQK